jgi:two-component system phosphate regulon sensor histidine kinase PhoR
MNSRQDGQPTRTRAIDSEILEKYIESIALLEQQIENLKKRERTLTRLTASLERRNLRLEELNAMKDEFIGIASHQLRTPATGVKQYINLLLDGFADDLNDNQKMFLERANESNDRQLHIIDDLLRVARIDSDGFAIRKTEVDPVLMVEEVADILKSKLDRRHQQLVIKKPKQSISVNADPDNLRMVLENLIDNASNYTANEKKITISFKDGKGFTSIIIKDEGVGIDKKDYPKLFQKFSRIPNQFSVLIDGTGLGLYWAEKVVSLHNGSIDVRSEVGKGSTFTINLPK